MSGVLNQGLFASLFQLSQLLLPCRACVSVLVAPAGRSRGWSGARDNSSPTIPDCQALPGPCTTLCPPRATFPRTPGVVSTCSLGLVRAADGAVWAQDAVGCGDTLGWSRSTAGLVWQRRQSITEGAVSGMSHALAASAAAAAGSFGKAGAQPQLR